MQIAPVCSERFVPYAVLMAQIGRRQRGDSGLEVSALGVGCTGLSHGYGDAIVAARVGK
jgi:hypothetical protein